MPATTPPTAASRPLDSPILPEPERPDPFVKSDPFWGSTTAWVAIPIIVGFMFVVAIVAFTVGFVMGIS